MKQIKNALLFFGRLDRGLYPVLLGTALLETLEGFGVLLISSAILNQLASGAELRTIFTMTGIMVLSYGLLRYLRVMVVRYKNYRELRLYYKYQHFVVKQIFQVPYWYLEKEDFVETVEQVRQNDQIYSLTQTILGRTYGIAKDCFSVLVALASFLQLFGVVKGLGESAFLVGMLILGLFLVIIASTGYIVWRRKKNAESSALLMEEIVKRNKVGMYLVNNVIVRYPFGKHIRLYGMQKRMEQEEKKQLAGFDEVLAHMNRLELKPGLAGGISSIVISGMIYLIVSAVAMAGKLRVGSILWYAGVVQQLLESVRQMIGTISGLYSDCTRYQVLFRLIGAAQEGTESGSGECGSADAAKEKILGTRYVEQMEDHTLEFADVSFAYPGTDRLVLEHVNLRLSGKERVALVGQNGCGKSTLIKLICRLYEPTEGRILLDGADIREIDREEYMDFLAVVFQDYQIFACSLGENIALNAQADEERLRNVIARTELGITEPDIPLRRDLEEEGIEVSGGEGQKIAIARALYKDAPMVILDEPTAALDPLAESAIYEKFGTLVAGKLALFISHRLSSCRLCDRILVLQGGRIVQDGSHEELAAEEGLYREMWEAQRQYYA